MYLLLLMIKEQDQRAIGEQLIQEENVVPDQEEEQPINEDQQGVPNPVVPQN